MRRSLSFSSHLLILAVWPSLSVTLTSVGFPAAWNAWMCSTDFWVPALQVLSGNAVRGTAFCWNSLLGALERQLAKPGVSF